MAPTAPPSAAPLAAPTPVPSSPASTALPTEASATLSVEVGPQEASDMSIVFVGAIVVGLVVAGAFACSSENREGGKVHPGDKLVL